jgi:hypothetical protein
MPQNTKSCFRFEQIGEFHQPNEMIEKAEVFVSVDGYLKAVVNKKHL